MTHAALFVEAINRWATQEAVRTRGGRDTGGPTLFDFVNPLELRVEAVAAGAGSLGEAGSGESELRREHNIENNSDYVTAELVRLFQESPGPQRQEQPENGRSLVREE